MKNTMAKNYKKYKKYKNNKKYEKYDKNNKSPIDLGAIIFLILIVGCFFMAFLGLRSFFSFKVIKDTDIKQIKGTVNQLYLTNGKNQNLNIKLKEYPQEFYVSQIQSSELKKRNFESEVFYGDDISISISKEDFDSFISNCEIPDKKITVYSFSSKDKSYLNLEDYNKSEHSNGRYGLAIGCIFAAIGIGVLTYFIRVMVEC